MSVIIKDPDSIPWDKNFKYIEAWNQFIELLGCEVKKMVNPADILGLTRFHLPVERLVEGIHSSSISKEMESSMKELGEMIESIFFTFCKENGLPVWDSRFTCPKTPPEGDDFKSLVYKEMFELLMVTAELRSTNLRSWFHTSHLSGGALLWVMKIIGTEFVEVVWDKKKGQFVELSQEPEPEPEPEVKLTDEERVAAARAARKARRAPPVKATCASVPAQMTPEQEPSILDAAAAKQRQQKQKKKQQRQKKKGKGK